LGQIIAYFKYQSTKEINCVDDTGVITKLWQRNYHEHIVRNEKELQQKTDYILNNPSRWGDDQENLKNNKLRGS
jgi:putative transposase